MSALEQEYPRSEGLFLVYATAFSVLLVLTNIIGIKLFTAPHSDEFALTTGIITYPLTFLLTDIVSEIWGQRRASFMVIVGFGMSVLMLCVVQLALYLPAHPYWVAPANDFGYSSAAEYQNAFSSVFSVNGKLLLGSMLAYMVAQLLDVRLFHFWKRVTAGKHLWLRNNGSTLVSQLVDTAIVGSILFYWGFGWDFGQGVEVMMTIYAYKVVLALIDTPLIYAGVWATKRWLKLEEA